VHILLLELIYPGKYHIQGCQWPKPFEFFMFNYNIISRQCKLFIGVQRFRGSEVQGPEVQNVLRFALRAMAGRQRQECLLLPDCCRNWGPFN